MGIQGCKPTAGKQCLLLLAGGFWSFAGVLLLRLVPGWILAYPGPRWFIIVTLASGIVLGAMITLFGFRHIATKNIRRIIALPEQSCLFAFQRWQGYLLVAFMMSLGIAVRKSQLVPPLVLAGLYTGIGGALLVTSCFYYKAFARRTSRTKSHNA